MKRLVCPECEEIVKIITRDGIGWHDHECMKKKRDWTGIEPTGWKQSKCSQCIACKMPLFEDKDARVVCFWGSCRRYGLFTAIVEPLT